MYQKIISIFILVAFIVVPVLSASSSLTLAGTSGSMSLQTCSSSAYSNDNIKRFGNNSSGQYTEDNIQTSILTNGRTYINRETKSDSSTGNFYAAETKLATDYMGLAEDTAGMLNIQPNEPKSTCDTNGFLDGSGSSGSYPVSESYEGRTGAVFHDGGSYASEVGLNDGDVHLQSEVYSKNKAIQYMNVLTSSIKGFDRNSTVPNMANYEHISYVGTTVDQETREEVTLDHTITHDFVSYVDAFEEPLAKKEYEASQTVQSISAERLNETPVNETVNATPNIESVNETPLDSE